MERWVLSLQPYNFKVVDRPGKTNIADSLSRLKVKVHGDDGEHYDYVRTVVENNFPCSLTLSEIEKASAEDLELNLIKECVRTSWLRSTTSRVLNQYFSIWSALCAQN